MFNYLLLLNVFIEVLRPCVGGRKKSLKYWNYFNMLRPCVGGRKKTPFLLVI